MTFSCMGWEPPTLEDIDTVTRQLGRSPRGMLGVVRRCSHGKPSVIAGRPVIISAEGANVMPTVFWLTCPAAMRAVGKLENENYVGRLKAEADSDPEFASRLHEAHSSYRDLRLSLIDPDEFAALKVLCPGQSAMLESSGIGGIKDFSGVKCLHLHLADYYGRGSNPVGERVHELINSFGLPLECDLPSKPCSTGVVGVINIGTNSVKSMAVDVSGLKWNVLFRGSEVTRLGEGIKQTGELSSGAIARTVRVAAGFYEKMRRFGAENFWITATSAAREARNPDVLIDAVKEATDLDLEIISGEDEAALTFSGVTGGIDADPGPYLVFDTGGGSTEFIAGSGSRILGRLSIDLGAVSATEIFLKHDPPSEDEIESLQSYCLSRVRDALKRLPDGGFGSVIGVGGGLSTLASLDLALEAYDRERLHGHAVSRARLDELFLKLRSLPAGQRALLPGFLQPKRAPIMVAGGAIVRAIMDVLGAEEIVVSESGILEGMVDKVSKRST